MAVHAVDHVVMRFPEHASVVRRLYLSDEHFRSVCEDYLLCLTSLKKFESRPDAQTRPEIDDYRQLQRELELEMTAYLSTSRRSR